MLVTIENTQKTVPFHSLQYGGCFITLEHPDVVCMKTDFRDSSGDCYYTEISNGKTGSLPHCVSVIPVTVEAKVTV